MTSNLPHSEEAEKSIIGAILLRNNAIDEIDDLVAEDFYIPRHKEIFQSMKLLSASGIPLDTVTISDDLEKRGKLKVVGGESALVPFVTAMPTADNIRHYATIIRDKSAVRRMIAAATIIVSKGRALTGSAQLFVEEAESAIFAAANSASSSKTFQPIKVLLKEVFGILDKRLSAPDGVTGVPTGFSDIDRMTAGMHPSELIVLAARPGMGKTSFALSVARNCARNRIPVLMFSLEMSSAQLAERVLCSESEVDSVALRRGKVMRGDMQSISDAANRLAQLPIAFDGTASISLPEIKSRVKRFLAQREMFAHQEKPLALVVIDYLQLMSGDGTNSRTSREREVATISRGLKMLAKEIDCPILALSQLNRGLEARTDKRPMLSDLRESGAIEQDADQIMFIYRECVYQPDEDNENLAEIIIGKNRHGPISAVKVYFDARYTKFANLEKRPYMGYLDDD